MAGWLREHDGRMPVAEVIAQFIAEFDLTPDVAGKILAKWVRTEYAEIGSKRERNGPKAAVTRLGPKNPQK